MNSLLEKMSIGLAIISLFLTIYFSKDKALQLIFIVFFILCLIFYFIYQNKLALQSSLTSVADFNIKLKNIEEKLDVYERLNKLEREVFKR